MENINNLIEIVFGLGMFINAGLFIPQALKIYRAKSAQGASLISFAGFNILQITTFLHGYLHADYLLMLGMVLSLITCGTVTLLICYYQFKKQ